MVMNAREADQLGERLGSLVETGQLSEAYTLLSPVVSSRTPFRLLNRIGAAIGAKPVPVVNAFLELIAAGKSEGGWPVIGSVLRVQYVCDPAGSFDRCRYFVTSGDVWYATDILGERLPGPALVVDFAQALQLLTPWRADSNRWLRRTVGVAVHFWAKRSRGAPATRRRAETLLAFLEPLFTEQNLDAVKGVGWGLKTLGRYYPDILTPWLARQVVEHRGRYRATMLHKALTYLPADQRLHIQI